MKKMISLLVLLLPLTALAQQRDPMAPFNLFSDSWTARWIRVRETGPQEYGVYHFCKEIVLEAVPARYVVHVTGDNRYKLYVNGTLVSAGLVSFHPEPLTARMVSQGADLVILCSKWRYDVSGVSLFSLKNLIFERKNTKPYP